MGAALGNPRHRRVARHAISALPRREMTSDAHPLGTVTVLGAVFWLVTGAEIATAVVVRVH
jgi:hypothetical protein